MAILKRNVKIEWKINPNYFTITNAKNISAPVQRIGSARGSVNRMLTKDEMMRTLMPNVLGIDPTSHSSNWAKELADYWHSISQEVPEQGLTLDISLIFDKDDGHPIRSKYIKKLLSENKEIKDSNELMKALTDPDSKIKVTEDELYRYAEPVSVVDYLLWYYCQGYRRVANDLSTVNKSTNIDFYMYSEETKKEIKKAISKNMILATNAFVEISKDPSKVRSLICIMSPDKARDTIKMSDEDLVIEAHGLLTSKPDQLMNIIKDKHLELRGKVELYINVGVLKRIPETKVVVDGIEQTKVLGHTMEEVIVYLTTDNPENKKHLNEIELRFKELTK